MSLAAVATLQGHLSEYDIPFGNGIDPSTRRYILRPNPDITTVGGVSTGLAARSGSTTARIIFYTPGGSNTGPLSVTAWGVTYAYYTRTTMAGCSALVGTRTYTLTGRPPYTPSMAGYGDWVLFPAQTLTFPVNGETFYGNANSQHGASKQYLTVYGTYDTSSMLDFTKWNTEQCTLDFSNVNYFSSPVGGNFFFHQGRYEQYFAFSCLTINNPNTINPMGFYTNVGSHAGILFDRCVADGAPISMSSIISTPGSASNVANKNTCTLTSVGTLATATMPSVNGVAQFATIVQNAAAVPFKGYISGTTLTFTSTPPAGLAVGQAIFQDSLSNPMTQCYLQSGSGSVWTVDVSQTAGSVGTPIPMNVTINSMRCCVSGDTSNKYNGIFQCFYLDPTHITFTFGGSSNAPATGSVVTLSGLSSSLPDIVCVSDVVFNQCGLGYTVQIQGAHAINCILSSGVQRVRFYDCLNIHGGYSRKCDRTILTIWNPGTTLNPITSMSRSGSTVTALTPTTTGLTVGGYVYVQNATASSNVNTPALLTGVTANTSFTFDIDANAAPALLGGAQITGHLAGNTLTVDTMTSGVPQINQLVFGAGITTAKLTAFVTLAGSISGTNFTATTAPVGSLTNGRGISGIGLPAGITIVSQTSQSNGDGLGGRGVYVISSAPGTFASQAFYCSDWTFNGSTQTVGSSGSPVTISICPTWQDPAANGYDCSIGDPPDNLSHGLYMSDVVHDIRMFRLVTALECVNSKFTGGPYTMVDCVDIRGPASYIMAVFGNDNEGNSWADGAIHHVWNHLQVFSTDLRTGDSYGWGAQSVAVTQGSTYENALILNNSNILNGAASTAARLGMKTYSATGSYAAFAQWGPFALDMRHGIMAGWGGNTDTTNITTFSYNVTDDSSALPGTVNKTVTASQVAFQTAITNTLALDIANTFRLATPELSGVTVQTGTGTGQGLNNAANLKTEQNCFDFMLYNPQIQWASKLQAHFRQYLGR